MTPRIAYLPGDGIGPEVLAVARHVLEAAGFRAAWVELPVGWNEWCERGDPLPRETLDGMRTTEAALFGAITSKPAAEAERELVPRLRGTGLRYESPILRLRREFDLAINFRPVRNLSGSPHAHRDPMDLVLFRENTEDLYVGVEAHPFPADLREAWARHVPEERLPPAGEGTAVSTRVITRRATERVVRAAFAYARAHGRHTVTLVEKPNVLRATGGLVHAVFRSVAEEHPELEAEELNVDAACALLVRDPAAFDVVVATNLFGDIFSDIAAEVAGGLALAAAANLGDGYAVFEPVHGSAPPLAGKNLANPLGAVLAGALLARHLGRIDVAERVEGAVSHLVAEGRLMPPDLGGSARTEEVAQALLRQLEGASTVVASGASRP